MAVAASRRFFEAAACMVLDRAEQVRVNLDAVIDVPGRSCTCIRVSADPKVAARSTATRGVRKPTPFN